ncbi:unnamed protein product [Vitrella brassicaformis CCMP3155]|uniref:Potassium channel tetramerisation-type BTB domain-containing protein n=1 Tax=Vitrella brassicaformis (strain CCMP3155) TaxID=1169540 RepID=A0A0G4FXR2_VITBC|nr:unnamed protein product [Vitrella brassicaformis CCMP3155]|eukprot:CEM20207.1 unnamed protein product [Vitrella brassicaformis CCMP3155]
MADPSPCDVICVCVGGKVFECTRRVLTAFPDSLPGLMFSGRNDSLVKCNADGHPFLDYNPMCFELLYPKLQRQATLPEGSEEAKRGVRTYDVPVDMREEFNGFLDLMNIPRYDCKAGQFPLRIVYLSTNVKWSPSDSKLFFAQGVDKFAVCLAIYDKPSFAIRIDVLDGRGPQNLPTCTISLGTKEPSYSSRWVNDEPRDAPTAASMEQEFRRDSLVDRENRVYRLKTSHHTLDGKRPAVLQLTFDFGNNLREDYVLKMSYDDKCRKTQYYYKQLMHEEDLEDDSVILP